MVVTSSASAIRVAARMHSLGTADRLRIRFLPVHALVELGDLGGGVGYAAMVGVDQ